VTESTSGLEVEISRRRLLVLSAVAIPAGALLTGAGKTPGPNKAPIETQPTTHPSAAAGSGAVPAEQVYFC
jgi:hypothetical protein